MSKAKRKARQAKRNKKSREAVGNPGNVTSNVNRVPTVKQIPGLSMKQPAAANRGTKEAICSITNPFCPEAYGAKIPDGSGARTFPAAGRGTFNLTTGATGGSACAVVGAGNLCYSTYGPTSFPLTTATGQEVLYSGLDGSSLFGTNGDRFRIVSAGFTIRCTESANNAQGWFLVKTVQSFAYGNNVTTSFVALDCATLANYPGAELSYTFKPLSKFIARQFALPGASGSDLEASGWPTAEIVYQGGQGGVNTIATVEYFINIEFLMADHSTLASLAAPPLKNQPSVVKAAEMVQTNTGAVVKGGTDVVTGVINKAVDFAWKEMQSVSLDELLGLLSL